MSLFLLEWNILMDRRTFLLTTAATLCPSIAFARRRCVKCEPWLPVIRIENGRIVNTDFLFEGIPNKKVGLDQFTREVHAWLNEPCVGTFYGEVLVKQWGAKGCWVVATWIQILPESKIK
jgi:hypothetical protein